MADLFQTLSGAGFDLLSMTSRVNKAPYIPGQARRFFSPVSINTLQVAIEEKSSVLTLVQTGVRGASGDTKVEERRVLRSFTITHLQRNDAIYADEVTGVREFGTTDQLATVNAAIDRKLMLHRVDIDATIEHQCMSALQGTILDADASTILNLNTAFGTSAPTEKAFDFASNTDPNGTCGDVLRTIEDNLGALMPVRYHALAGPTFIKAMAANSKIVDSFSRALVNFDAAAAAAGLGDWTRGNHARSVPVYFGGIWWEEYRGGTSFIAADKAVIFPVFDGIAGETVYPLHFGPADVIEAANTMGLPMYSWFDLDRANRKSVPLEVQSNPLPLVTRPNACHMARSGS